MIRKYITFQPQSEVVKAPQSEAVKATPSPITLGETLAYAPTHRKAVAETFQVLARYPGPSERKSLAKLIDELTNGGVELVQFHLAVLRGQVHQPGPEGMGIVYTTVDQREKAAKWLTDRGYGKAVETIKLETEAKEQREVSFDHLSLEERTRLLELEEKVLAGPTGTPSPVTH